MFISRMKTVRDQTFAGQTNVSLTLKRDHDMIGTMNEGGTK